MFNLYFFITHYSRYKSMQNSLAQGKTMLSNNEMRNRIGYSSINNHNGFNECKNTYASVEGFTGMLGHSQANKTNEAEARKLKEMNAPYNRAISSYATAHKQLMEETAGFINSSLNAPAVSQNDRLGNKGGSNATLEAVKFADGKMGIVTDRGILKPMSQQTWQGIKGKYGCPASYRTDESTRLGTVKEGDTVANKYYVGSNMSVQGCPSQSGINAHILGAANPLTASSSYVGSFKYNQGTGKDFEVQDDLTQTYSDAVNNDTMLDLCASRAVDLGRPVYGVYRDGDNVKCSVIKAGETWQNVEDGFYKKEKKSYKDIFGITEHYTENVLHAPIQSAVTTGVSKNLDDISGFNSVSMLFDGRLAKTNISSTKASLVDQGPNFINFGQITSQKMKDSATNPIVGSGVYLQDATYGGNCDGQVNHPVTDAAMAKYQAEVYG